MAARALQPKSGRWAGMRQAYVVADGEAVGLVCLSVHYKNSVMFLANDVKAHATLQRQNADGKRACLSLMIS